MSQGALYKQFGSKHSLIAATTEHVFDFLVTQFKLAFETKDPQVDSIKHVLKELWRVFRLPQLYAVMDLYIAARTDAELRAALFPVLMVHRGNLLTEAERLFPMAAQKNPRFALCVDGLMAILQGAAMVRLWHPSRRANRYFTAPRNLVQATT